MDIESIEKIVTSKALSKEQKEFAVIRLIALSKTAIQDVLKLVDARAKEDWELVKDLNELLSLAHVAITTPKLNKDDHVQSKIYKFYEDNDRVRHNFKIEGIP